VHVIPPGKIVIYFLFFLFNPDRLLINGSMHSLSAIKLGPDFFLNQALTHGHLPAALT